MKRSLLPLRTIPGLAVLIAVLCTVVLVSNSRPVTAAPAGRKTTTVTIDSYTFHPGVLTVMRDTTVVWNNRDEDVHTIRSKDGPESFNSPALETGSRFRFTFHRAGTYHYICTVHPYMHGVIVVR